MHRVFPLQLFCALFALYVSGFACATAEPAAVEKPLPNIALLLPLDSPVLGAAARAVHQGILAAAGTQAHGLPVRVYPDEARNIVDTYKSAIANGAVAVLGPLTRDRIRQLANEKTLPVPTLALNIIDGPVPQQMYFFGMAIEAEAQQVARLARKRGLKQAIVIANDHPFARRLQYAFEESWTASGGEVLREIDFNGDTAAFADLTATPDSMVFFATDVEKSRTIRPYLPANLAVYGTSQIFSGNNDTLTNFDLDGIRFVDMPWVLQDPAVTVYPHASPPLATDQDRLYALGIDAYRLIRILLAGQAALPLDGVTGNIRLNGNTFGREALPALFVQGRGQSADAPVIPVGPMFPVQIRNASSVDPAAPMAAELPSGR